MVQACPTEAAVSFLRAAWPTRPRVGIVLGTGLANFVQQIQVEQTLAYADIPDFPVTTALSHQGRWICGSLGHVPLVAMQGRFHPYEGYSMDQVAMPIRVMRDLGIELLVLSNASGGVNPRLARGDILVIDDHLNLMWGNPLIGPNEDRWGPRFPDMSAPYDPDLVAAALRIGRQCGYPVHQGVYAGFLGPNYETRAEYRMLRRIGADVVGMSTVPEVLAAVHAGIRVLALSVVTNVCSPDQLSTTDGAAVVAAAAAAEPQLSDLAVRVILQTIGVPS